MYMKEMIPKDDYGIFVDSKDTARTDELVHKALLTSTDNLDEALSIVDEAFFEKDCPWIESCVRETVMAWYINSRPREQEVYTWFKEKYKSKLGNNYQIVKRATDGKNIPDFWVFNGTDTVPVECKLHSFDKNALKQLQRYMTVYNCQTGIAVGSSLTVELPETIIFIGFDISELTGL